MGVRYHLVEKLVYSKRSTLDLSDENAQVNAFLQNVNTIDSVDVVEVKIDDIKTLLNSLLPIETLVRKNLEEDIAFALENNLDYIMYHLY